MQTNQNQPFTPFPSSLGTKPYYTPGLSGNYTTIVPDQQGASYYSTQHEEVMDSRVAARELVNFTVLKYLTTAASSPFEVSKTLLQVQYLPRQELVSSYGKKTTVKESESDSEEEVNKKKSDSPIKAYDRLKTIQMKKNMRIDMDRLERMMRSIPAFHLI